MQTAKNGFCTSDASEIPIEDHILAHSHEARLIDYERNASARLLQLPRHTSAQLPHALLRSRAAADPSSASTASDRPQSMAKASAASSPAPER